LWKQVFEEDPYAATPMRKFRLTTDDGIGLIQRLWTDR